MAYMQAMTFSRISLSRLVNMEDESIAPYVLPHRTAEIYGPLARTKLQRVLIGAAKSAHC